MFPPTVTSEVFAESVRSLFAVTAALVTTFLPFKVVAPLKVVAPITLVSPPGELLTVPLKVFPESKTMLWPLEQLKDVVPELDVTVAFFT